MDMIKKQYEAYLLLGEKFITQTVALSDLPELAAKLGRDDMLTVTIVTRKEGVE